MTALPISSIWPSFEKCESTNQHQNTKWIKHKFRSTKICSTKTTFFSKTHSLKWLPAWLQDTYLPLSILQAAVWSSYLFCTSFHLRTPEGQRIKLSMICSPICCIRTNLIFRILHLWKKSYLAMGLQLLSNSSLWPQSPSTLGKCFTHLNSCFCRVIKGWVAPAFWYLKNTKRQNTCFKLVLTSLPQNMVEYNQGTNI